MRSGCQALIVWLSMRFEKAYVVVTPEGDVVKSEPLPGDHRQAEGIAITKDSLLLVSDEANVTPPKLTVYRWRP